MINTFRDKILINGLAKEQNILNEKIISSLFKDIPKLKSVEFSKSDEYDDNNYYDSTTVNCVNDIVLDGEEYSRENGKVFVSPDDEEIASEDDVLDDDELELVVNVINKYAESVDYGQYTLTREDFDKKDSDDNTVFRTYYQSLLSEKRAECESLFSKDINIAVCYARDILKGRLSEQLEKSLEKEFKKDFFLSYIYAVYCVKGKLPKNIDNYFTLKSFKGLSDLEKKYLNLYREFVSSSNE